MNKKNILILIKILILIICTILLLYISNTTVIKIDAIYNHKNILKETENYELKDKDKVYNNISGINIYKDIMNSIYFYGCVVCETDYPNENRKINIYFISDNNSYMITPPLEYNEKFTPNISSLNIKRDAPPCYSLDFSTINMKDGEYRIYTEVIENEHNYGSFQTDIVLDKRNKDIQVDRYFENAKKDNIENEIDADIQSGFDKLTDRKACTISGYAFFKYNKTLGEQIYVGVKDTNGEEVFYETKKYKREDVGRYYKDDKLSDSGFTATVKLSKIDNCELSSLIIYKDGKYFKSENKENKRILIKSDNIIEDNSTLYNIVKDDTAIDNTTIYGTIQIPDNITVNKLYIGLKDNKSKETYYTVNIIKDNKTKEINEKDNITNSVINTTLFTNIDKDNNTTAELDNTTNINKADIKAVKFYDIKFTSNIKINDVVNNDVSSIIIESDEKYYKKSIK